MTHLEIILLGIVYLTIGLWICHKRNWYNDTNNTEDSILLSVMGIFLMPINLIVVLFKEFILRKWDN